MRLTKNIAIIAEVDLTKGIKAIRQVILGTFPDIIIISPKKQALEKVNIPKNNQII